MITDPQTRIERMLAFAEARFAEEFVAVLALVRQSIDLNELAALLEQGRSAQAFEAVATAASRLNVVWAEQFVRAGTQTGQWLGRQELGEIVIGFDQTNTRAVQAMRNNGLRLVSNFTDQQRRATNQALLDGIQRGANPREMARLFRDSIGLTPTQERWIRNYENALRNLDGDALRRELRDRRFDPTVRRAIEEGRPLTQAQVNRLVGRYRERALKLRSETIARTEALRSVHEGTREMYRQALDSGTLQRDQLVREWQTASDERVRDFGNGAQTSHRSMHGQQRQIDEPFTSGAGNQTLDPGAFGVGYEDINCRCVVTTRILTLDEIPSSAGAVVIDQL